MEENLDLFRRMRAGEFPNGARVLRAKIDMTSGNMNLRDPVLYRILHATHPRTGDTWSIYPTYDFAHGQSDAIEHVTHSVCTLEFEDHRPLYDWLIENLPVPSRPRQYEFARLNVSYTILSKRHLTRLVTEHHVSGWDDPRMPTLAGIRRRGVPAAALREFVSRVGVARAYSTVDVAMFEFGDPGYAEPDRSAPYGGLAPVEADHRELSRRPDRDAGGAQPPRQSGRRQPAGDLRPRALCRAGRLHGASAEEVLPSFAGQGGPPALWLFRYLPGDREGRRRARSLRCAAPTIRLRKAAIRRTGARFRRRCTGSRRPTRCRRKSGFTRICSTGLIRGLTATRWMTSIPNSLEVLTGCAGGTGVAGRARSGRRCSSNGPAILRSIPNSKPGRPVFNRTVGLRDTWAKVQAAGRNGSAPAVADRNDPTRTSLLRIDHLPRHAAVDHELRAGDEPALRTDQKRSQGRDVGDCADPAGGMERMLLGGRCGPLVSIQPGLMQLTRISGPRLIANAWVNATSPPLEAE